MRFELTLEDVGIHQPVIRTVEAKDSDAAWAKGQDIARSLRESGRLDKQHGYLARCRPL